jgi:hypothetical protein
MKVAELSEFLGYYYPKENIKHGINEGKYSMWFLCCGVFFDHRIYQVVYNFYVFG